MKSPILINKFYKVVFIPYIPDYSWEQFASYAVDHLSNLIPH